MGKKIKLYTTLFIVAFILNLVFNVFHFNFNNSFTSQADEKLEMTDLPDAFCHRDTLSNGSVKWNSATVSYSVNVVPKMTRDDKVLMSHASGDDYMVRMQKVEVVKPWDGKSKDYGTITFIVCGIVFVTVFCVWILWIVFKTIRSIRRGEVFVTEVSHNMEVIGKLLVGYYIISLIIGFLMTQYYIENIHIANYSIVFSNDTDFLYVLTGLGLMILSQIILMGKELKEENELTI